MTSWMKYINLTPHAVVLRGWEIAPTTPAIRCVEQREWEADVFVRKTFGEIENLPEYEVGTILIASALAAQAAWAIGRFDVVCPGDPVRDAEGRIIGCDSLCVGTGFVELTQKQENQAAYAECGDATLTIGKCTYQPLGLASPSCGWYKWHVHYARRAEPVTVWSFTQWRYDDMTGEDYSVKVVAYWWKAGWLEEWELMESLKEFMVLQGATELYSLPGWRQVPGVRDPSRPIGEQMCK